MESFIIKCVTGPGSLEFSGRLPADPGSLIEQFSVRLTAINLSAATGVYAGYLHDHPASLFAVMARRWKGWVDELSWESLEGELSLRCLQDRAGHVSLRVRLRSEFFLPWSVEATVMTDAGQLEEISRRATLFFGEPADTSAGSR